MLKEKVGAEEASTPFDAPASQDEASYDGDVSDAREDDIEVIPDMLGNTPVKSSGPAKAISAVNREVQKITDKSDGGQTSKCVGKNQAHQHSDKALSGTQGRTVSYDQNFLTKGHKDKYPKEHIAVHCVQWASQVLLMSCFDMLPEGQKMLPIFFHTDVTLTDGSTLLGGELPGVSWYPDMPEA